MRRASEMPVTGPAATDTVAASGGLELPGREGQGRSADWEHDREEAERMVPPTLASLERLEREKPRED